MTKFISPFIIFFIFVQIISAQGNTTGSHEGKVEYQGYEHKHSFSFFIAHTRVSEAVHNDKEWIAVPSFSLNYDYIIGKKWAIGLHNDLILEEFTVGRKVEGEEEIEEIERSYPLSSAVMISYNPLHHLVLAAGGGMEFSKSEHFPVIRFSVETPFHLNETWEMLSLISYDININAYNSFTIGLGVGYVF